METDLPFPRRVLQSQSVDDVRPSLTSPFLSSQVLKQLLALVNQHLQISLIDLIFPSISVEMVYKSADFGC